MKHILNYEWKLFRRDPFAIALWLFALVVGIYAISYGHSFHQVQMNTVTRLDTAYQNRVQRQITNFTADTSTKEGKTAFGYAHDPFMNEWFTHPVIFKKPSPLQALSIGQSDNQPFYNELWLYNDYIYNSAGQDLQNPDKLLSGNFDLSFVFVYLLPLLIIAYCYAVYSSDQEAGITSLMMAQGASLRQVMQSRLLFRFLLITALVLLLSAIGFVVSGGSGSRTIALWTITGLLYAVFWFSLVYALVALRKSSSLTALMLVGTWVLLLVVVPSAINNLRQTADAERVEISDAQREYSIHIWDLWQSNKKQLCDTLFAVKPDWAKYVIKDTETVNSVAYSYFDMLYMNRIGGNMDSAAAREQLRLDRFNYINPAYTAQQVFNQLAATELYDYVNYRKAAAAYQKQRSETINELLLSGKPFTIAGFQDYPVFRQPEPVFSASLWLRAVLPLIILSLAFFALAGWKNKTYK